MGTIGSAVAKRANGFGMKILYHNRNRREVDEKQFGEILVHLSDPRGWGGGGGALRKVFGGFVPLGL